VSESTITASSRIIAGRGGFHQVVLAANVNAHTEGYTGFYYNPGGPHTLAWGGAPLTNLPLTGLTIPTVIQDTDGYSGTPGDWQFIAAISSVTIPAGLDGTYTVGIEGCAVRNAWWPDHASILEPHPPSPHAVPYVPGGNFSGIAPGDGWAITDYTITVDFRVNGAVVATKDYTGPAGMGTATIAWVVTDLAFAEGDVITATITWHDVWGLANFCNALGMSVPSTCFAVFFLTRTGGGQGVAIRGSVDVGAVL